MSVPETTAVLTLEQLADRWSLPLDTLRRRLTRLSLPAVNIGTTKSPDYRFRLSAIEAWEQMNEETLGLPEAAGTAVPSGAPPGLEGYDPFKGRKKRRAK